MVPALDPDLEVFLATTRRFLQATVPVATIRDLADDAVGFSRSWWSDGAALGWVSLLVGEGLGGGSISGVGLVDLAAIAEEFGRVVAPGPLVPTNVAALALSSAAQPHRFEAVLEAVQTGSSITVWADEAHQSQAGGVTATPETSGGLILDGIVPAVEAAAQAEHVVITATGSDGRHQLLVPLQHPGVTVTPVPSVDIVRRFADVRLTGVGVTAREVIHGPGGADAAFEHQQRVAVALRLSEVLGALDAVFGFTMQWMFDRYSFGRPIASYQALKHRVADMKVWLEASRATVHEAVRATAHGAEEAAELISVAKSYVGQHAPELVQECVQLHGGIGVTWDHDLHLYLRRVTLDVSLGGTVRDHRRRLARHISA